MIKNWIHTFDCKTNRNICIRPESIEAIIPFKKASIVYLYDGIEFTIANSFKDLLNVIGYGQFYHVIELDLRRDMFVKVDNIQQYFALSTGVRVRMKGRHVFTLSCTLNDLILLAEHDVISTFSINAALSCIPSTGMES